MEVSELSIKLIILLLPGAISSLIYEKLTIHREWTSFKFVANSILLGGLSYLISQLVFGLFDDTTFSKFWQNLPSKDIPFRAVTISCCTSVLLGFIWTWFDNYKVLNKLAKLIRVTTKYGDENLFYYFLGSPVVVEVYLRDIKNNITYHGIVESYSENDKVKEIVLSDVKVYSYAENELAYKMPKIYLCKPADEMIIELPIPNLKIKENGRKNKSKINTST